MNKTIDMNSESRGFARGKKKKGGNKRSQMLRMVMPLMSHTNGEKLANAIDGNNVHLMREVMSHITQELAKTLEKRAGKGGI